MSRTGIEAKPPWRVVPKEVCDRTESILGAKIRRAERVYGGYTPTPTYRLRLADGRRAFFKAVSPESNAFATAAHHREARVYRELGSVIAPFAPAFYGEFEAAAWEALLLEDLGPKSVPPWSRSAVRGVSRAYGEFHQATQAHTFPDWVRTPERQLLGRARMWNWAEDSTNLRPVADLAGNSAPEAMSWLEYAIPILTEVCGGLVGVGPPYVFLHGDTRSDNLRWRSGRLSLVDWPHVGRGPPEDDLAAFAQSVTVEGGPQPDEVVSWYGERMPVRPEVLDATVAAFAGYFANAAWQPDIPGLPRLRSFQRRQLKVTLAWAARRLKLPAPGWLEAVVY
jgi:aminoglycoside phosphotransferase (APT) family kinase protein